MRKGLTVAFILFLLISCTVAPEFEVVQNCLETLELEGEDPCGENTVCGADGACHPCGEMGELCCAGNSCGDGQVCGADGVCASCGGDEAPCCSDDVCETERICDNDGFCRHCGNDQERCCEGDICFEPNFCDPDGFCRSCGAEGETCCTGNACEEWHFCDAGICVKCGGEFEIICPESGCARWFMPIRCPEDGCAGYVNDLDGRCVNPFKMFANVDVSICENLSEEQKDWCTWHAAYFGHNLDLCEKIGWQKMKDICLKGLDPDNYATFRY